MGTATAGALRSTVALIGQATGYPVAMARPEPEWLRYERWVASLIKARAPEAEVAHNVPVLGHAGFPRQVDVLASGSFPGLLPSQRMVVEVKYRRRPVGPSDVAALRDLMDDVDAPLGSW